MGPVNVPLAVVVAPRHLRAKRAGVAGAEVMYRLQVLEEEEGSTLIAKVPKANQYTVLPCIRCLVPTCKVQGGLYGN